MHQPNQQKIESEGTDPKNSPQGLLGGVFNSSQPTDLTAVQAPFSPLRFLFITIGGIFLAEVLAMIVLTQFSELPYYQQTLLDATIMVIMIFPLVYYFSLRPLLLHIEKHKQMEVALQKSDERFAKAFHLSPVALSISRVEDGEFIDVNESFLKLYAATRAEVIGRTSLELGIFINPVERQELAEETVRAHALAQFGVRDHELEVRIKSGEKRTVLLSTERLDLDGVPCILSSISDITERKTAEVAIRQLSSIVEQTGDTVVVTDRDGAIEYVNPAFENLTGYTRAEVLGKSPSLLKSGLHDRRFYDNLWKTVMGGGIFLAEIANRKKNGELFYEIKTITPLRDPRGMITHFVATGKDITDHKRDEERLRKAYDELELRVRDRTEELQIAIAELEIEINDRKRAEEALRKNEVTLRGILDATQEAIWLFNPEGVTLMANQTAVSRMQKSIEDVIGENLNKFLTQRLALSRQMCIQQVVETGVPVETEDVRGEFSFHHTYYPVKDASGQVVQVVAFSRDITARKQAEQALRFSEQMLKHAQAVAKLGNWTWNLKLGEVTWSDEMYQMFGIDKSSVTGRLGEAISKVIHPEDLPIFMPSQSWALAEQKPIEYRVILPDRSIRTIWAKAGETIMDEAGTPFLLTGIAQDITERKQAEEALRMARDELELRVQERTEELAISNRELMNEIRERKEVERTLRLQTTAMEAAAYGILITDAQGTIQWANPALTKMTGYTAEELLGKNTRLFKSGDQAPELYEQIWKTILAGQVWRGELSNRRKDGSLYIEAQTITPVRDENDQISHFIALKEDITEHKQVEEALEIERLRLRNIMDTMPDGIYIVNRDFEIEYVNPVIQREFGAVNGRKCYAYFHDEQEPCAWCKNDEVLSGKKFTGEQYYAKSNRIYELFDAPLVSADGSISKLKLLHDITHRKQAEQKLEQRNVELQAISSSEREQRQLAEALVEAAIILNKSLKLDEVLAHILEQIKNVIPYQLADVMLLEGETFYDASHKGELSWPENSSGPEHRFLLADFPLFRQIIETGRPILIPDTRQSAEWVTLKGLEWSLAFLSAPLLADGKVIGFVNLFAEQPVFFTQAMRIQLVAFAAQAAVAIQNAWLFEQVRASSERLQSLSRRLVEIQENERHYIARELHDEAGQMLTSLIVDLRLLERNANQPEAIKKMTAEMEISLNQVLENLHRVAMALRPASLDHLGLVAALKQQVESVGEKHNLKISFRSREIGKRLPENVETVLYRIVQEALTNVVRHAQATMVDVVLTVRGDKLIVIVEDNGVGFDPEATITSEHLGLFGIRERTEMIDGKLIIESQPGKGTTLIVEVNYADSNINRR